jgi:diguanylate cyclase (GGDEF)-like protein
MFAPVRLRDFLIVALSLCLVIIFLYFSQKAYLLWFLTFIPIFLAGWVWHRAGAFIVGVFTLASTSILIYLELISQSAVVTIPFSSLLFQIVLGFTLIFLGGLGVGKISEIAAAEEEIIKQITLKDKTTDLFTERYFKLRLEDEIRRGERFEMPFSLLLLSVDTLADFRETFGTFRTDLLLRRIARIMERCVREIDLLARYEDGFALLLPGVKAEEAVKVAERIRTSVEKAEFEGDEVEPRVKKTLSIGVAQFPEDAFDENELLTAARQALIRARERGGNQTVTYTPLIKEAGRA